MYWLFGVFIILITGFNVYSQYRWNCQEKVFTVVFPVAYRDTIFQLKEAFVHRSWADDQGGNRFVAECKKNSTSIPQEQYKNEWKKYHDEVLKGFLIANHLEKTVEKRFDVGKFHGIYAILNHKTKRLTYFYKNIIIGNRIITIYVVQPRSALNFKIVKKFFKSARYRISLLE